MTIDWDSGSVIPPQIRMTLTKVDRLHPPISWNHKNGCYIKSKIPMKYS